MINSIGEYTYEVTYNYRYGIYVWKAYAGIRLLVKGYLNTLNNED